MNLIFFADYPLPTLYLENSLDLCYNLGVMSKEVRVSSSEQPKHIRYFGGSIEYSVLESTSEGNPVVIVPGFTEGRFVLRNFAETFRGLADRTVVFPDQPVLSEKSRISVLDQHAKALLAIIDNENLEDKPVDFIAHSFGAMVVARAAELATELGITSFDSEKGSHTVFIAPAGTNDRENLAYLGGRWLEFMSSEANPVPIINIQTKELDPTGEMLKAGQKNATANIAKSAKEVRILAKKKRIYAGLGNAGLKPFVFGYASDRLFPHRVVEPVLSRNADNLAGYAVPIDNSGVGAGSFSEFKTKTGLKGRAAKKAWAHHYRSAGHNDFLFHPERTAKAVLQVIEQ